MRNVSSAVIAKPRLLIDSLRCRTIACTVPTATTTTLRRAATSADTSSVQVTFIISRLPASCVA